MTFGNVRSACLWSLLFVLARSAGADGWTAKTSMSAPRSSAVAGVVNGILYVAGGHDGTRDSPSLQAYNPATDSWTNGAAMNLQDGGNTGRYEGAGGVIDGKLYLAGGWRTSPALPTSSLQIYNPADNTWTTGTSLPILSGCSAGAVINRKLYLLTACDGYDGYRQFLHVYDPDAPSWTQKSSLPSVQVGAAAVAISNLLYVVGGNDGNAPVSTLRAYDPGTDTWSTKAPMPTARQGLAAAVLDGKLYAVGGWAGAVTNLVEVYDPASNTWSTNAPMPTARVSLVAGVINGKLYAAGGGGPLATLEVFEPPPPLPTVVGSLEIGMSVGQLAVNPHLNRLYVGSGYGGGSGIVLDVTTKTAPQFLAWPDGAGVGVNPATGRYYLSSGTAIRVYNGTNDALITTTSYIGYCGGQFDVDESRNLIYLTSQCGGGNDPLHVLDGNNNTIVAGPLGSGGVLGSVHVNPTTGRAYVVSSIGTRVFGPSPSFSNLGDLSGSMQAVNPVANRLYFTAGGDLAVRDGSDHSTVTNLVGAGTGAVAVNTNLNRFYVIDSPNKNVRVYNATTHALLGTFVLGANVTPGAITVDATKCLVYVSGGTVIYVVEDPAAVASPPTITTVSLPAGQVNQAYSQQLQATGGTAPYTWALVSGGGSLPAGLGLSSVGAITGTPTTASTNAFSVKVTDAAALSVTQALSIAITSAPASTLPVVVGSVSIGSQSPAQIAVNPNTDRVYIGSGYAEGTATVFNVANKNAPAVVTTVSGAGVTVNPASNRFYTSSGFGGTIRVYNGIDNTLITTSTSIGYCGGQLDVDETRNLVYMTSQCGGGNDPLHVLDGSNNSITGGPLGSGGIVGSVRVNPATGRAYVARSGGTRVFGPSPSFANLGDLTGTIAGVNSAANLLYFSSGSDLLVRDGSTHALVATITGAAGAVGVNTNRNRVYVPDGANQNVRIIDGNTHTMIGTFTLGAGVTPGGAVAVDSAKNRIYVTGSASGTTSLYVIEDTGSVPLAVTTQSLPDGQVGQAYSAELHAGGGALPYTWTLATGSNPLPTGLSLSSGGTISGTPTVANSFTFTVQVTDNTAYSTNKTFTVSITSGAAIQLASQNYLGATGDERGTALAIAAGAVYVSGVTAANGDEGLVARYALPVSSVAAPVWQATWPNQSSGDHFYGIAAAGDSVYLAGDSYQRTSDTIGGKENKGIVMKFPLDGATGGGFGGAVWDRPTPPTPGAFGYGGSESLNGIAVAIEGAQTNVYATGQGQSGFSNGGRMYLSKLAADSTVLWTVTDAASQAGNAYSSGRAVTTLNGNMYVAGRNDDSGSTRAYLRKYDASGTSLWSLASSPGEFYGVTAFGGAIYAVGATGFGLAADFLIEKRDESGNVIWTATFDRNSAEDILYGVVGIGSRIYAVGSTKGNTAGGSDAIVLEIDPATGALLSSTLYGGGENDLATGAATDGVDLYVVGSTRSFGGGDTDLLLLRYTVAQPGQALAIATTGLSAGFINQSYSAQLQSVGGTLPHTWSLASGSGPLPGGLTLSSGGMIQGAPTASGTFAFTVQVTDSATPTAATATKPLSITVSTTNAPPSVALTSPANGATFTAPASIQLAVTASDTDGTIAKVEFYAGPTLLGTVTSSPFTLTLTNQSAGSYSFTAVATDNLGASQTSAPINVTVNATGGATLINFDPLDAAGGVVTGDALSNYLAGFGVTLSNVTAGTRVVVMSDENIYAGQAALASSRKNVLTQVDSNDPVNFTLRFASPLASFTFTRPKLIAGPSGITHPYWRARTYDASGEELGSVREELIASFSDVPAATFTLNGPGIMAVRFESENRHFAAFNAVLLDDFVLTGTSGNAPPSVNLTSPANGATFTAPANITLTAAASDTDGSVARVEFFSGGVSAGIVLDSPYTLNLTNVGPGSYTFQAVATDDQGATRSSASVSVTVNPAANTTIVNFDALNAVNGSVGGVTLANYLAGFGITLSNVTAGTRVEAVNNRNLYGGAATVAPSLENLLTQVGLNTPVSFTLQFSAPQVSVQFTRPKLVAGPSGVTHPFWRARAFDATGVELSSVTEQLIASFSDVPAKTFSLNGPGVAAVRFDSENRNFAAFSAVLLDDLVLTSASANSPPTVSVATPANNASFAAPANVTVTATAADGDGSVARVDFYLGTTRINSVTNAPYTLALTNLAAGSYALSARAVDNLGATTGSTPVNFTVTGSSASTTINFDALDAATGGEATGAVLVNYLATFGVTISELSLNTRLSVLSDTNIYGDGVVEAPSRYNVLTQLGSNDPVEYALRFGQPLESFQFTRPKLFAGPSGVTHPFWRVRAFDAAGVELGSVTEQLIASFSDVPAQTFKLTGPGIKSVQVESENRHFAAFSAVLLDNLVLNSTVTNNPPTVSITSPTNGATFAAASDLTINATAADSDGTVARVDFYANTNILIGADSSAPYMITWSNVAAGTYSLTARATDNGGAERASIPVTVNVTSPAAAPTIVAQPRSQSVAVGAYVSFSVAANGFQPLHYQWRFKGANIPVTTSTLIIPVAQVGDSGVYSVVVTNSFGTVASVDATLAVLNPVSITSHPQGQVVLAGSNVTLAVTANGSGPLRYQWQLNGTIIPDATNSTVILNDVRPFDSGSYRVVAANALGAVNSQTANLVVLPAAGNLFQANNDNFQDRLSINPLSGPTFANNIGTTREPGEPIHGGKQGDKSVWFTWRATFSGEMALTTRGSGFDTLLAVYTNSTSPTALANLVLVAEDDDAGEFLTSRVTFNAVEGLEYQIAVDGFDRASGTIVLGVPPGGYRVLNAGGSEEKIPRIVNPPQNRTVHAGDNVTNTVSVVSPTPVSYQWFFNRVPIQAATNAGYVITNVQPAAVGHYTVLVYNEAGSVRSAPVFVEVGPAAAARSHDKFSDLLAAGGASAASVGKTAKVGIPGVSPGVTGTQILRNFGATTEVGEPNHAGVVGGASRWFSLQAAGSGTFVIDTIGSDIDTVLAVYTGADLFSLNQVAADDNSAPDGIRSLVKFDAVAGTTFAIAVDGVNGAQGEIKLNWQFGNAPAISQPPGNLIVQRTGAATFTVSASGTPTPAYQWRFNGVELPGQTNASLSLLNVQSTNQGPYSVVVSNFAGTASATAQLTVQEPAQFDVTSLLFSNQQFQFRLTGEPGLSYAIEASTNLLDWMRVHTNTAVNGQFLFLDSQSTNFPRRFYRSIRVP